MPIPHAWSIPHEITSRPESKVCPNVFRNFPIFHLLCCSTLPHAPRVATFLTIILETFYIMLLKLSIMLLSNVPNFPLSCSNYSHCPLLCSKYAPRKLCLDCSIRVSERSIRIFQHAVTVLLEYIKIVPNMLTLCSMFLPTYYVPDIIGTGLISEYSIIAFHYKVSVLLEGINLRSYVQCSLSALLQFAFSTDCSIREYHSIFKELISIV